MVEENYNMKKIIFGITGLTLGGAERVLVDVANKLIAKYDVTIFTIYAGGELEKELEQYDKDMWRHLDCLQKYKHIGEEIPKDVPFTEYFGYIFRNFRNPKPEEEWTVRDYKVDAARKTRQMAAFIIKDHGYKEPLTDRQKRVVERIRNGTDFHVSLDKIGELFK